MSRRKNAAAKLSELKSEEMKKVGRGGTKMPLARVVAKCYVVGANCLYYTAMPSPPQHLAYEIPLNSLFPVPYFSSIYPNSLI